MIVKKEMIVKNIEFAGYVGKFIVFHFSITMKGCNVKRRTHQF